MKKQIKILITVCILILIIVFTIFLLKLNKESVKIQQKGYEIFGYDYCIQDHSIEGGGDALTEWKCEICGKSEINSDTNTPVLCWNCAMKTNRCNMCGKLLQ